MCAFTFFKHVLSSVVKSSMPNPIFKAINVNCVFYLRCGKKKKKQESWKNLSLIWLEERVMFNI